ncbi:MAG: hypothetical protein K6G87_01085 [Butyrivibrio sp.]|uniref:hypothetical protein n=1 Tax=Butyrivibrio sp. TaxID=28121 RepID=UPI0025D37916|nr:hypothetical protein [Butyrivibrio sp.]MCR5769807.1 hypothetical protein [Butyrivibrio sp.]
MITDLPEKIIKKRYEEELKKYWPYIVITVEQGEAFRDFHRNEHKHEMRSIRHHDALDFQEEIPFVQGYGNLVGRKSKARLEEEIARIEGVSRQAVHETLSSAVRLLREFVEG